jgi:predicted transcriptional regulator
MTIGELFFGGETHLEAHTTDGFRAMVLFDVHQKTDNNKLLSRGREAIEVWMKILL